jgi:hypothetical protein
LLLHSLDLDDHMVLNNHADFTVLNAFDGVPNLVENRIGGLTGA